MFSRRTLQRLALLVVIIATASSAHAQWKRVPLPGKYDLGYYLDVMFLPGDARYGWACSLDGYAVRTTNGGVSWQGSDIGEIFFEHIQFLDRFVGYTSGSNGIFKSTNGGATWFDVTPQRFFQFPDKGWGCYFLDALEGFWFVGGCGSNVQQFFHTTDGGATWDVFLGFENNTGLTDGFVNSNGEGYAVSSGLIWRTRDGGDSWQPYARTPRNAWTEEITKVGSSWLFPISGSTCDGEPRNIGQLMFTSDDARTWRVFETGAAMFGTFLLDDRRGWGVGDNGACYYTDDAGERWRLRNCGLEGVSLDDVWFINDTLGWIAGAGMFRSNFNAEAVRVSIQPTDTIRICLGDTVPLSATDGMRDYIWNDGATGRQVVAREPGMYVVTAVDPETCVESTDTVVIAERPTRTPEIASATGSTTRCQGDTIRLQVTNAPFVAYVWSTGDTTATIDVTTSGRYHVDALDTSGCWKRSLVLDVTFVALPVAEIMTSGPTTFCLDDSVVISVKGTYSAYLWSNGATTSSITIRDPGTFYVVVTNEYGCIDTSEIIAVDVIRTRNKIDLASIQRPFIIADHDVGGIACADLRIRNRSADEPLVIARPYLVGNVIFGIPAEQLPLVIAPGQEAILRVCCAAVDTGMVDDTLYLPDTCSPSVIPIISRGRPYDLDGTSRCNVATATTIIRAGHAYRLTAPFPNPTDQGALMSIVMPVDAAALDVHLMDGMMRLVATGSVVAHEAVQGGVMWTVEVPTHGVADGSYIIVLADRTGLRHAMPLVVMH